MEVGANRLWTGVNSRDGRGSFAAAGEVGGAVLAAEHSGGLAADRRRADQLPQKLQALSQLAWSEVLAFTLPAAVIKRLSPAANAHRLVAKTGNMSGAR